MSSWYRWLILISGSAALSIPISAYGMAGGGGGYSSGGGGSGGSSDGGFIIELIWLLLQLCIEHPKLGLPLLLILVVSFAIFCLFSKDKGTSAYQGHVIRKGNSMLQGAQKENALKQIMAFDPQFSESVFLLRVRAAFTKIQTAWCNQNMQQAQVFVSDGIVERFSLQLAEQRDLGYRDRMDDLFVEMPEIAQVVSDVNFDTVSVRVATRCRDYRVSLKDGKPLQGLPEPLVFAEYWSFLRRRGAKTVPGKPGLIEGNCPNCGVGIEMNQSANCPQCKALLRSGQYDWVLSEITQESEWRGNTPANPPGLDAIRQVDPEFNLQNIEDRVSVMFWRRNECGRTGKIDALKKIATPAFCEKVGPQLSLGNANGRSYWGECAVGSVDTLGLKKNDEKQRALVEVRWAGTQFYSKPGEPVQRSANKVFARSYYVISRNAGVQTKAGQSLVSSHCPGCGAPEHQTTDNVCQFCGTMLNDGSNNWALEEIEPANSPEGQALLSEFTTQTIVEIKKSAPQYLGPQAQGGTIHQIAWVIQMCAADGEITEKERYWINSVAERWKMPREQVDEMIAAALKGAMEIPEPKNREEARSWLEDMTRSALADGYVSSPEEKLLIATGKRYGYAPTDVRLMINLIKTEMYQAAREAIRETKIMRKSA